MSTAGATPAAGQPDPPTAVGERTVDGAPSFAQWQRLVSLIQVDDPRGMEELYQLFAKGIRFHLCRHLAPQELDDKLHDIFLVVLQAIRRGELREPERLMGFIRTIVRRQVAAYIDNAVTTRREQTDLESNSATPDASESPEQRAIIQEQVRLMRRALASLSERDREVLTRFYIKEQTQEEICEEMALSETQFRLLKSRAKARLGEAGRRTLLRKSFAEFLMGRKR